MKIVYSFILLFILASCSQTEHHTPKPKGYPRVERMDSLLLHQFVYFSFEYSSDAILEETPSENKNQVWFNLEYPKLNAVLYCTFASINQSMLKSYFGDTKMFVRKNAEGNVDVREFEYQNVEKKVIGSLYYFDGNFQSPYQFYLTDRTSYFLRGSLYYTVDVLSDSILSTTKSIEGDLMQLLESFDLYTK